MEAIKHSNALPTTRDWNFYVTSPSFTQIIAEEGNNVLRLMNHIMKCNSIESNIKNRVLDDKTELVVEANDVILERVANYIDEMNGIKKNLLEPVMLHTVAMQMPVNGSWNSSKHASNSINRGAQIIKLITGTNIVRPQKFFKDKIDNGNYPWEPKIKDKPNSLKPLAIFLEEGPGGQQFSHPYEYELDLFTPLPSNLQEDSATYPKTIEETPLVEVETSEQLSKLIDDLRNYAEISVDVEHHSYRSFMGITCLIQISTKDTDYLIDTLSLRHELYQLNEIFTKPAILKIFHGADKDIEWLQRDLNVYIVNMFDTYRAAKVLEYSALSLAYLMRRFCQVIPNKQFQLADWRIRPLPLEFKQYAREDTHYLIYIYKMMKQELFKKAGQSDRLVKAVFDQSTEVCKKVYYE